MLKELAKNVDVYLVTGYTDMRKGIDGLATIVQGQLKLDPFNRCLFLFCGRNRCKMKGLLWEGDGFLSCTSRKTFKGFRQSRCTIIHSNSFQLGHRGGKDISETYL